MKNITLLSSISRTLLAYLSISASAQAMYIVTPTVDVIEATRPAKTSTETNDFSIAGKDVDNDGIRDDVERYVYNTYKSDKTLRQKLYDYSYYMQIFYKANVSNSALPNCWYTNYASASSAIVTYRSDGYQVNAKLLALINNVFDRQTIFYAYMDSAPIIDCK